MQTIDCPKCGYEHEPTGIHEDDSGEQNCDECGFNFFVEVEYSPSYSTCCMDHEWGPFEIRHLRGEPIECRFCNYCDKCQLREEAEAKNNANPN